MNRAGLRNPIETRKALLICVANQRFTTLNPVIVGSRGFMRAAAGACSEWRAACSPRHSPRRPQSFGLLAFLGRTLGLVRRVLGVRGVAAAPPLSDAGVKLIFAT